MGEKVTLDFSGATGFSGRFWLVFWAVALVSSQFSTQLVDLVQFAIPNHGLREFNYLPGAIGWGLISGIASAVLAGSFLLLLSLKKRRPILIELLFTALGALIGSAPTLFSWVGHYFPTVPIVIALALGSVVIVSRLRNRRVAQVRRNP